MVEQDALAGETSPSQTADTAGRLFGEHPSVMLLIDPASGEIVDANRAAADFYGWPRERLRGMSVGDLNTLAPAAVRAEMNRAVAGSRSVFAFRHRLASGATRDVEVHSGPIDLDGRTLLHSVVVDVTERNEAVAALQASEELASGIVAHAAHGIAVTDLDGRLVRVNAALCAIVGRTEDDLLGSHYFSMTHPEDRAATAEARARLHRGDLQMYEMRKRYLRGDGTVAHVQVASSLLRDGAGRPTFQLGIVEDVTQRVAMERALDRKMAQETALAQLSHRAVGERDIEALARDAVATVVRTLDAAGAALLRVTAGGQQLAPVAQAGVLAHASPLDGAGHDDGLAWAALASAEPVVDVGRARDGEAAGDVPAPTGRGTRAAACVPGRVRPWGVLWVHDERADGLSVDQLQLLGSVAHVLGSAIGRREAEDQLQQAQKLEAIGRLAGSVAHDMNNVLTAVLGQAELLAQSAPTDVGLAGGLAQIREAGQRGAAVTRRILAHSRAHSGEPEAVEVAELVAGLRPMLDALVGHHIELQVRTAPAWVRINRRELEQAVLNLAVNACDAMPDGGRMTIDAAPVAPDCGWVRLGVVDTGVGMDADTLARATEAFFTTKDADHGTGLGLSMVDELVTSVGGTLTVDSTPGQGTSMYLRLPADGSEPSASDAVDATGRPAPAGHVLVVEDDDSIRDLVTRVLERAGHRVTARASGESAWEHVGNDPERIDLLLTDTSMPGMTGRELADRLRAKRPDVAVVLMSGHPDVASAAAADPELTFLPKPFTGQELRDAVSAVLGRARPA